MLLFECRLWPPFAAAALREARNSASDFVPVMAWFPGLNMASSAQIDIHIAVSEKSLPWLYLAYNDWIST